MIAVLIVVSTARAEPGTITYTPVEPVAGWTARLDLPEGDGRYVMIMIFRAGSSHGVDLAPLVPPVGVSEVRIGLETSWIATEVSQPEWSRLWTWWSTSEALPGTTAGSPFHGLDPGWRADPPPNWWARDARLALVARPFTPRPPVPLGTGVVLTREFLQRIPSGQTYARSNTSPVIVCTDAAAPAAERVTRWRVWTLPGGELGYGQALWLAAAWRPTTSCVVDAGPAHTLLACPAKDVSASKMPAVGEPCVGASLSGDGMIVPVRDDILLQILALAAGDAPAPTVSRFLGPAYVRPPKELPPSKVIRWVDPALAR